MAVNLQLPKPVAEWLAKEIAIIERKARLGLIDKSGVPQRRYRLRLLAQGKCLRCKLRHTTGRDHCPLCRPVRSSIARRYRRKNSTKFRRQIEMLSKKVERLERELDVYRRKNGKRPKYPLHSVQTSAKVAAA